MQMIRTAKVTQDRIERAMRIYEANLIRSMGKGTYVVKSESSEVHYIVNSHGCTCPDAIERQMLCKHTWACFMGAVLTIWRIQLATSEREAREIEAAFNSTVPQGIRRTITLECDLAIARLTN